MYTGIWAKSRHIVKLLDSYFGVLPHPVNYTGHQDAFMFLGSGIPSLSFQVPLGAAEVDRMLSFRGGGNCINRCRMASVPRKIGLKRPHEGKMMLHDRFFKPLFLYSYKRVVCWRTEGTMLPTKDDSCSQAHLLPAMKQSWKICLWFSDQRNLLSRIQLR